MGDGTATRGVIGALLLGSSGCWGLADPVAMSANLGQSGWFQLAPSALSQTWVPQEGGLSDEIVTPVPLHLDADCQALTGPMEGLVVIMVHGIAGDGAEWSAAMPGLLAARPAAMFLFRWVPYDGRDPIVHNLTVGLTRILQCFPSIERVAIVAHSAGGVVVSYAAGVIALPRASAVSSVDIVTVASPLAGTRPRARNTDGRQEVNFLLEMATAIRSYPPPARSVSVVHARTSPASDPIMRPSSSGWVPNDPRVGVPGACQLDLPPHLGHDQALSYVARLWGQAGGRLRCDAPDETAAAPRPPRG